MKQAGRLPPALMLIVESDAFIYCILQACVRVEVVRIVGNDETAWKLALESVLQILKLLALFELRENVRVLRSHLIEAKRRAPGHVSIHTGQRCLACRCPCSLRLNHLIHDVNRLVLDLLQVLDAQHSIFVAEGILDTNWINLDQIRWLLLSIGLFFTIFLIRIGQCLIVGGRRGLSDFAYARDLGGVRQRWP